METIGNAIIVTIVFWGFIAFAWKYLLPDKDD